VAELVDGVLATGDNSFNSEVPWDILVNLDGHDYDSDDMIDPVLQTSHSDIPGLICHHGNVL
jgi:hypothetical protein